MLICAPYKLGPLRPVRLSIRLLFWQTSGEQLLHHNSWSVLNQIWPHDSEQSELFGLCSWSGYALSKVGQKSFRSKFSYFNRRTYFHKYWLISVLANSVLFETGFWQKLSAPSPKTFQTFPVLLHRTSCLRSTCKWVGTTVEMLPRFDWKNDFSSHLVETCRASVAQRQSVEHEIERSPVRNLLAPSGFSLRQGN